VSLDFDEGIHSTTKKPVEIQAIGFSFMGVLLAGIVLRRFIFQRRSD